MAERTKSNSSGTCLTTLEEQMRLFDRMPQPLRRALANAIQDYGCSSIRDIMIRRGTSETIALVEYNDRQIRPIVPHSFGRQG